MRLKRFGRRSKAPADTEIGLIQDEPPLESIAEAAQSEEEIEDIAFYRYMQMMSVWPYI